MQFSYILSDIRIDRKEVQYGDKVYNESLLSSLKLDIGFVFNVNEEENLLSADFHVAYVFNEEGQEIMPIHYDVVFDFRVNKLAEVLASDDGKKLLHLNIISIAYSTLRGIVFMDTRGLSINKIYLPPLSPQALYNQYLNHSDKKKNH